MRIFHGLLAAAMLAMALPAFAQTTRPTATTQPARLAKVVVTGNLDLRRDQIAPSLGAVTYTIGPKQIEATPLGSNANFQQVLLQAPGVVEDSYGQFHIRGEHADVAYRVNGVILPEPINGTGSGFGQELDTHIIQSATLIDGTLPAEFGFRAAGIVDVTTKSGASLQGGEFSVYGGSYDTINPSIAYGSTDGNLDYFVSASYKHDALGLENPTQSLRPDHDITNQEREFDYFSYHLNDTSRISLLLNASYADFQIPDVPRAPQVLTDPAFTNSSEIQESQNEQEYYAVLAYQYSFDDVSFQTSVFSRYGQIHYEPDDTGDLVYQGTAGEVFNNFFTNGLQVDCEDVLNDQHTLRFGGIADYTTESLNTNTLVVPETAITTPASPLDASEVSFISDNSGNEAVEAGVYLQDEWRMTRELTVNYGARFDTFNANFDNENQISPRVNAVLKLDSLTTVHGGYARYFDPPPVQDVRPGTIAKFDGTSNAAPLAPSGANEAADAPKVERSNYFDAGISRQIIPTWTANLDGYYKFAHNLVDLGQFGAPVILSPFNYESGYNYGAEISSTYKWNELSIFGNFAWNLTKGRDIDSQQYLIASDELSYIRTHYIHLDHQGEYTASGGISYNVTPHDLIYTSVNYGSGLRAGFANTQKEPQYAPVNLGYQHEMQFGPAAKDILKVRFDVLNVFDEVYQLRNGTGIGVSAPQYGARRAFYVGVAYDF